MRCKVYEDVRKGLMMKRVLPAILIVLLAALLFMIDYGCAKKEIRVKANKEVVDLIKTWNPDIFFFTSRKNPLQTIQGLRQTEIACWGLELAQQTKAFYDAADIQRSYGNAVQLISPKDLNFGAEHAPRLYITWKGNATRIDKQAVRVVFTE